MNISIFKFGVEALAIAIGYALLGKLGQMLAIPPGNVTPVWPPSGFALAMMLLIGPRAWAGILLGAFVVNTVAFIDDATSTSITNLIIIGATIGIGSALQPLTGAALIKRFSSIHKLLDNVRNFLGFVVIVPVMCLISSSVGVSALFAGDMVSTQNIGELWLTWWLGDSVGVLLVTPFIIVWRKLPDISWHASSAVRLITAFSCLILVNLMSFSSRFDALNISYSLEFLAWPFLLWLALLHSWHAVTSGIFLLSVIAITYTVKGHGPFFVEEPNLSLLLLQLFLSITAGTVMVVTALAHEHRRSLSKLRTALGSLDSLNLNLEKKISDRTHQLEKAKTAAENLARTDFLTGLNNRMAFMEHANIINAQSQRYKHAYSIAMIDIDHFKSINDTWGHETGDKALAIVANAISKLSRNVDVKGRIGGEEFAVFLPMTSIKAATDLAERLREGIAEQAIETADATFNLTVSIGVAGSHDGSDPFETILAQADEAMYGAKNTGRNKVEVYTK